MRVVLDTNVLVSAFIYGGKPKEIVELVANQSIEAVLSPFLLSEFLDILSTKFYQRRESLLLFEKILRKRYRVVYPKKSIHIIADPPDNHVLEAALEGEAEYIISGDHHLLAIKKYKGIVILRPSEFLRLISKI